MTMERTYPFRILTRRSPNLHLITILTICQLITPSSADYEITTATVFIM